MNNSVKFRHSAYDSYIEFSNESKKPRAGLFLDRSRYNIDINEAMAKAISGVINYDSLEVVDICVNCSSISFSHITVHGVVMVQVVRNSLESFTVTTIRDGFMTSSEVETMEGFYNDPEDFEVLIIEVCKDYWIKW